MIEVPKQWVEGLLAAAIRMEVEIEREPRDTPMYDTAAATLCGYAKSAESILQYLDKSLTL